MKKLNYFLLTKSIGFGLNFKGYFQPEKAASIAYRLFSEPRKGQLAENNLPEMLQDVPSQIFDAEDHFLKTYIWKGDSTVILLVHGWESNSSRWEKLLPYLQETGSTIVAIDAPGHGLSGGTEFNVIKYASYIDVAVRQYQPNIMIGHSIGGAACIYHHTHFQNDTLEKMVILGAPSEFKTILQNYVTLLSLNNKMKKHLENHFSTKFSMPINSFSSSTFAEKIKISGLIIHDVDDKIVSFDEGQKIANSWKNAAFIPTKGLGHSLHDDEIYKRITAFLKS
jgi:pimeloyl-ACP methyl ester carboxylesterase